VKVSPNVGVLEILSREKMEKVSPFLPSIAVEEKPYLKGFATSGW